MRRRYRAGVAPNACEVAGAAESGGLGDPEDGMLGLNQQAARALQADVPDLGKDGPTGRLPEP